jgi:hypothetical protein
LYCGGRGSDTGSARVAVEPVAGLIQLDSATKSINRKPKAKASDLAGLKG